MIAWREPKQLQMDNQRPIMEELIMGRKLLYTKETYYTHLMELLPDSNFTLDVYTATEKPCEITCNICGSHYVFTRADRIARRAKRGNTNVCKKCENNSFTEKQHEAQKKAEYILQKKETIQLVDGLKSWASQDEARWKCIKCNHTFLRAPVVMFALGITNCPWCESRPGTYTEEMIKEQIYRLWGDEYTLLQSENLKKNKNGSRRILVQHNACGFKYETSQYNFCHGQGCPRCKKSHGERKIMNYLQQHNFAFQQQYTINTGKHLLKLDFYLEEQGKKYAIEYNGIQHYQPIEWFGGNAGFQAQQERDLDKIEYCKNNDINLIIIPYNDESLINSEQLAQRLSGQVTEEYPSRTDENIV